VKFSNKSSIEPHAVVAEIGPQKAPVPDDGGEDDKLFDFDQLWQAVSFVVEAVRQHKVTAVATFVLVLGATAALANLWPKTYEADGRLLLQRNEVTASLVNPGRTIPREAESPTAAAREIVLGRDNVLAVMKATNLLEEWSRTRAPLLRFKDWLFGLMGSAPTEGDRIDALAGLIEDRLEVGTSDEGTVSFSIRWPDAQMAYRLVDEAMNSFLQYRRVSETAAITESIAILNRSAETLEAQVAETIARMPRRTAPRAGTRRPAPVGGPSPQSTVQLSRLRSELEARQQEIARMAAIRSQQLSEARGRLTSALTIYTDGHPTVLALRQAVEQLSRDSPELVAASREVRELEKQYDALSIKVGLATEDAQSRAFAGAAPSIDPFSLVNIGDEADPVSVRLRVEMAQLAAVRERANSARAELESAEAGFKYRYSVIRPPRVPRRPSGPNVAAIMLAGAIASMILAIGVPVARRVSGL
jgi:succinoglycan biosynthesis transport protein ExoP